MSVNSNVRDYPMNGFLDQAAPSVELEYSRYIDLDVLGKILTKNFLVNRLGYQMEDVVIPVGRYGDAGTKYAKDGLVAHDPGDGQVKTDAGPLTFEIKCARINIANRYLGHEAENWAFTGILHSPGRAKKDYDILIAIGVRVLGLEDARFWDHLTDTIAQYKKDGRNAKLPALPHEEDFLALCDFFVVPFQDIPSNYFRLTLRSVRKSRFDRFRAMPLHTT